MSSGIVGAPTTSIGPTGPQGSTGGSGPTGPSGGPTGAAGAQGLGAVWLPPTSQRLVSTIDAFGGTTAQAATVANRMYATPIVLSASADFDRICVQTFNTTASNFRLGIYNCGSDGLPGSLVSDCGALATSTAAFKTITISRTLAAGRYFLVYLSDGTTSVYQLASQNLNPFGSADLSLNTPSKQMPYRTFSYGALPDPFGTITDYLSNVPCVALRVL